MVFKTGGYLSLRSIRKGLLHTRKPGIYLSESLPWNVNIERPSNKLHIYCFDVQKRALDKRD